MAVVVHWLRFQHRAENLSDFPGPARSADPVLAHQLKTLKLASFAVCIMKPLLHLQCRLVSGRPLVPTEH